MSKAFGKFKQWTGEKTGSANKTEASEDFKRLEQETEYRKECTEKINEACTMYIQTLGKKKDSLGSKVKKLPLEVLSDSMISYGKMLNDESYYGKALVEFGAATENLSQSQMEYVGKIRDGYAASIAHCLVEIKDYTTLKKKMESRRLDFDAKLNKVQKSKISKPELEEECRVSQMKYEDSLSDVTNKMLSLNSTEDESLDDLLSFVDAQVDYYVQCTEIVRALQDKLRNFPKQGFNRDRNKIRSTSPKRINSYASESARGVSAERSNLQFDSSGRNRVGSTSSNDYNRGRNDYKRDDPNEERKYNDPRDSRSVNDPRDRRVDNDPRESYRKNNEEDNDFNRTRSSSVSNEKLRYATEQGNMVFPIGGSNLIKSTSNSSSISQLPAGSKNSIKQVKVLYDFSADGPDELTIRKGEEFTVVAEIDAGWWEGEYSDGRKGMFPSNYVQVISTGPKMPVRPPVPSATSGSINQDYVNRSRTGSFTNSLNNSANNSSSGGRFNASPQPMQEKINNNCTVCDCDEYKPNAFKAGQSILFDATETERDILLLYHYAFIFKSSEGEILDEMVVQGSLQPIASKSFPTAGINSVTFLVSSQLFNVSDINEWSENILSKITRRFEIFASSECFHYVFNTTWNSDNEVLIYSWVSSTLKFLGDISETLTKSFQMLGDYPNATLRNSTHSFLFEFDSLEQYNTICFDLNTYECNNLYIIDIDFVNTVNWVVLTNYGVYLFDTSFLKFSSSKLNGLEFTNLSQYSKIYVFKDCLSNRDSSIFFAVADNEDDILNKLIFYNFLKDTEEFISGSDIGLKANEEIVSLEFDFFKDNLIILVGTLKEVINIEGKWTKNFQNCRIILLNLYTRVKTIGFQFPISSQILHMKKHLNFLELVIVGDKIWLSLDGGVNFRALFFALPGEVFFDFESSATGLQLFRSNFTRILYGKSGSTEFFTIPFYFNKNKQNFHCIQLEDDDVVSILIFKDELTNEEDVFKKYYISISSFINIIDNSFGSTLIPTIISETQMYFDVFNSSKITFKSSDYNWAIGQNFIGGGSAVVKKIFDSGVKLKSVVEESLVPETTKKSPCLNYNLDLVDLKKIGELSWNMVGLLLSKSPTSEGFLLSDVGKTVTVNGGSILIKSLMNNSYANGYIYAYPVSDIQASSGEWFMYDFRDYTEFGESFSQSLIIEESSGNAYKFLFSVTIETGFMKFTDILIGKILSTDIGWGRIVFVESESVMLITNYSIITNGTVPRSSWSIFKESETVTTFNTIPSVENRIRPWSLKLRNCDTHLILSEEENNRDAIYFPYLSTLRINGSVLTSKFNSQKSKIVSKISFLTNNRHLYKYAKFVTTPNLYNSQLEMNITDLGKKGQSILSLRPSPLSLKCKNGQKIFRTIYTSCASYSQSPTKTKMFRLEGGNVLHNVSMVDFSNIEGITYYIVKNRELLNA
ncbi:hypothetical protein HK099_001984 [Clydaea vesicula]|uniref:SH3 domain-containing protein n=1 Tax=Clydaea vesicula TaxID=447962 RepID=A0AAD5U398_9FUNG|nr:hypothetical protein HK099_001984 [Clydaea vesicula]